jgi:predicted nucleotidyltransferase
MPSVPAQKAHDLGDFAAFLRRLGDAGFDFAVIGGCAVAAYAHLIGEELKSVDLDVYVTPKTLSELLEWAPRQGIRVVKRPRPRNIPVAVLEADGLEIDALTSSTGLPRPEVVARTAREFVLASHGGLEVPLADPFDLLANKLAVGRDKDRPHVEILRRFVEEEAVTAFVEEESPRARLAPARQLVEALGREALPAALADRLIALARTPADHRFLVNRVPTEAQARRVLEGVEDGDLRSQLESILARRRFDAPG